MCTGPNVSPALTSRADVLAGKEKALPSLAAGNASLEQKQNRRSSLARIAGLGEGRADLEAEVFEVGLLARRNRLAAGLPLGFLGASSDVDRDPHLDLRMQGHRHRVQA